MKSHLTLHFLLFFSLLLGSLASSGQENKFGTCYNQHLSLFINHTSKTADVWVNAQLKTWCEKEQVHYVDLYSRFKNPDSELLNPQLTNDGLHLKGEGYLLWFDIFYLILRSDN